MKFESREDVLRAAKKLRAALKKVAGQTLSVAESLECVSRMAGAASWHVLSASFSRSAGLPANLLRPFEPCCYLADVGNGDEVELAAVEMDEAAAREIARVALTCLRNGLDEAGCSLGGVSWFCDCPEVFEKEYEGWDLSGGRWLRLPLDRYAQVPDVARTYVIDEAHVSGRSFWLSGYVKHGLDEFETDYLELAEFMPALTVGADEIVAAVASTGQYAIGSLVVTATEGEYCLCEHGRPLVPFAGIERVRLVLAMLLFEGQPSRSA